MKTGDSVLRIDEGLWGAEGRARLAPGVYFPARSTIVRLGDGSLLLHSPIDFTDAQLAAIRALGEVSILLSPNLFHHMFLAGAHRNFPDARIVGTSGLAAHCPQLSIAETIGASLPSEMAAEFSHVNIEGTPKFNEVVLQHRRSGTLIVGDYFFNIQKVNGWLTRWVLKMTGAYGEPCQSKLWRKMTRDKGQMTQSAREVLGMDYKRVVMCHGETVEDGRDFTKAALAWLTEN